LHAYQFLQPDERQLVQYRRNGFSFNRLAPYTHFENYAGEIERSWRDFLEIAKPSQIQVIRMRYINRILLPLDQTSGMLDLAKYLSATPRLPSTNSRLRFKGFLHQHLVEQVETGHEASIVLTSQPQEAERLPIILDITVASIGPRDASDWAWVLGKIKSLRDLKNSIFENTLTEACLSLHQ
jgi:uncharacterized protein (TIGR04255 family)